MFAKYWLERLVPFLILFVTLGTSSYADNTGVIPPPAGTPMVSGTPFQTVTQAMDKYGQSYVVPGPSGTPGSFPVGGTVNVVATPGASSFLKTEDLASASGDNGIGTLGIYRDIAAVGGVVGSIGDYSNFSTDIYGSSMCRMVDYRLIANDGTAAIANSILKGEDFASQGGDAGVFALSERLDTSSSTAGTNGDYAAFVTDADGRLYVNPAGTGAANTWQSCSASNTGTSDTAIKAAVASNRMYVTSISCFNTAAVASSIAFKDGSTQIYVGGIGNSTLNGVASWNHTLGVPLRGSVNTAFNFAMATNSTATTCCAAGYISTN